MTKNIFVRKETQISDDRARGLPTFAEIIYTPPGTGEEEPYVTYRVFSVVPHKNGPHFHPVSNIFCCPLSVFNDRFAVDYNEEYAKYAA